jgi:putative hydrolase of the HAD superfamily
MSTKITTLFLDIGGVLLSNGWGQEQRANAVTHFKLDADEINERHHLTFDTFEQGKLTLDEYLKRVVFYESRTFSVPDFKRFMLQQSIAYQETIEFFKKIKRSYSLSIIAVNNEGQELNQYRIQQFRLFELFDAFVSSAFVHLRKPDADIFNMAMNIAHTVPGESLYIDDRKMFVEVAQSLGMNGIHYQGLAHAKEQLNTFGLTEK